MNSATLILALLLQPAAGPDTLVSGLQVGEAVPSWQPIHVAGPDRGTRACPTCTYGARPMIQVFTKAGRNAGLLAAQVERLVAGAAVGRLKGFVTVVGSSPARLRRLARDRGIARSALCYPDPARAETDLRRKLKINPAADNTVIVYRDFVVTANFVNVDGRSFDAVAEAVKRQLE
jgi:protocatechuate 3,4-dioxygenase beta subunit